MNQNSTIRAIARQALAKKWLFFAGVTLVMLLISGVINLMTMPLSFAGDNSALLFVGVLLAIIAEVLSVVISYGFSIVFLRNLRDKSFDDFGTLFIGFKDFVRVFLTMFLLAIYVILWSCLLIIPGIIKQLSYSLTPYILYDNPELSNNAAIERSMKLMKGHKMQLFLLQLSFIGWLLLSIITLGVGLFFLVPYFQTSMSAFYQSVKDSQTTAVND